MRRTLTILAATALAAAVTIPAVAQDSGGQDPSLAHFTACLSAHGVDVPAGLGGVALKQWLAAHQDQAPVGTALKACSGPDERGFAELSACLRSHGVDVPSGPDSLKREVLELSGTEAGLATLDACHMRPAAPAEKGDGAPAGRPEVCGAKS